MTEQTWTIFHLIISLPFWYHINSGSVSEEREQINRHVWERFKEAREDMKQVHDNDLIRWGCEKATEVELHEFKASTHWVLNWKQSHRVVKRKINKRYTRREK